MIYFGDFWKIVFLVAFIVFAPPILWGVDKAHGQLQPPNAPIGEYVTAGEASGIRGVLFDGDGNILPGDLIMSGQFVGMHQGKAVFNGWRVINGFVTPLQITPEETEYVYFGQTSSYLGRPDPTDYFPLGKPPYKLEGENTVTRMMRMGTMWDINKDGRIDWLDAKQFLVDMDGDGIPNEQDRDTDGDGEKDFAEMQAEAEDDGKSYRWLDPNKFPDRDADGLPDWGDKDGDGVMNYMERLWSSIPGNPQNSWDDPNQKPANYDYIVGQNPGEFFFGKPVIPHDNPWADDDGDGAWDWIENLNYKEFRNGSGGADEYPDGDGDGIWDWGAGASPGSSGSPITITLPPVTTPPEQVGGPPTSGGGGTGGEAPPTPEAPTPAAPGQPFQIVFPQGQTPSSTPPLTGQASSGTAINDTNAQTGAGAFTGISPGAVTANPGYGNNYTPGSGGGSGGGTGGGTGGGEGDGNYQVVEQPKGTSTAWMGVGGGSWQYRSGNDMGLVAAAEFQHTGNKAAGLRNAMGQPPPEGVELAHSVSFVYTWIDGTTKTITIPLMPDLSTDWGVAVDNLRKFLRVFAMVLCGYIFIGRVWTALRQG